MDDKIKEYLDYALIEKKLSLNTIASYKTDLDYYKDFFLKKIYVILQRKKFQSLLKA